MLASISVAASQDDSRRLRVNDSRTAHLLRVGAERSPLLRELLATIEAGDVVVYMDQVREVPTRFAGSMRWIGASASQRYVRVSITVDLAPHDYVATIAHELQHVIEIIENPDVQDVSSFAALYARIGEHEEQNGLSVWDTAAAREVGRIVKREFLGRR
jgi:hypothetical protein